MNEDDLSFFRSWFSEQVKRYLSKDNFIQMNVELKKEHTLRVCKIISELFKDPDINRPDIKVAETSALFHDLGRFEQIHRYGTFDDRLSDDHARMSVDLLKKAGILSRLPEEESSLINKVILYHNLRFLPNDESSDCLLYSRLLRDADKLDILDVVTHYYEDRERGHNPAMELGLRDGPRYSSRIIEVMSDHVCVDRKDVETLNDLKLLQLSWVFDINFTPSYRRIRQKEYVDRIFNTMTDTKDIRNIRKQLNDLIEKKLMMMKRSAKMKSNQNGKGKPIEMTDETFSKIIEESPVAVIDCWAPWCGPCRMVGPIIEELAKDYAKRIVFGKLNVDENNKTATEYSIMSIPTILIFKDGKLVDSQIGAMPRSTLESRIIKYL